MEEKNRKNFYFPLFYNTYDLANGLTDAELGAVIREVLRTQGEGDDPDCFAPAPKILYRVLIESAGRVFLCRRNKYTSSRSETWKSAAKDKKDKENKEDRYGDFDPEEAFKRAVERSMAEDENTEKAE